MTEEQATDIYEGLVSLLGEHGLSWVIDEVHAAVTEGKTEVNESKSPQDEGLLFAHRRRRTGVGYVQRDWTNQERLALLINAIEAAVCGPALITSDLLEVVPAWSNHSLAFAADGLDREIDFVPLDGSIQDRVALARGLVGLLQEIRGELDANLD